MKAALSLFALVVVIGVSVRAEDRSIDQQIDSLISKMTLKEKVAMVTGNDPDTHPIPRLGIPKITMSDGPTGVRNMKSTAFPAGILVGASFDPELAALQGVSMADEARLKDINMLLGPCVNIARQPFGGRNFESYGEDPLLTSMMAASYIQGMQSHNVIATVKHFAVNDQEIERHTISSSVDIRTLFEIHFPAFKAAVDAGVWSLMSSYNRVNGVHASRNSFLLETVLRDMWGFKGFVVSDWTSTYGTIGTAMNGLDLEMPSGDVFGAKLLKAVADKKVPEKVVDEKVRNLLRVMFASGLMGPKKATLPKALGPESREHQLAAQKIAEEGMVLLKNDGILPLKVKTIAAIGPHALHLRTGGGGSSHTIPFRHVSPAEALKARFTVNASEGTLIEGDLGQKLTAKDFKNGIINAEYFRSMDSFGKPAFLKRTEKEIELSTDEKLDDRFGVRLSGELVAPVTGEFVFSGVNSHKAKMFIDGKKILDYDAAGDQATAEVPMKLVQGHAYKFVVESGRGDDDQDQMLQIGWRLPNPNRLKEAVAAAKASEVAVLFLGLGNEMESEGGDRQTLDLPKDQIDLLNAVTAVNPNTIVVLTGGGVVTMPWLSKVRAVLQAWYPGSEGGFAIARLLSGEANPSGKLPISYIKRWEDSSAYSGSKTTYPGVGGVVQYKEGIFVGYRFLDHVGRAPLFPFGFGLSYTSFDISHLSVSKADGANDAKVKVSFDVTNTGKVDGAEIAQVYVGERNPAVPRPPRELKAFKRVVLKAGETKSVTLTLDKSAFSYFDAKAYSWKINPGVFEIAVGSSSRELPLREDVTVQ